MTPTTADLLEAVAYWSEEAAASMTNRDDAIRAARAAGVPLRQLAEVCGVSHQTIANICARPG